MASPDPLYLMFLLVKNCTYLCEVKSRPWRDWAREAAAWPEDTNCACVARRWSSQNMSQLYWRLGTTEKTIFSVLYKKINTITTQTYIVSPPIKAVREAGSIRTDASFLPARLERNLAKPYQLLPVFRHFNEEYYLYSLYVFLYLWPKTYNQMLA
jgi:hypothetical protein